MSKAFEKATFAAGCFWKPQDLFDQLDGVVESSVGYTGGHLANPSYEQVCDKGTGHAEAVELLYDPEKISYEQLLDAFFAMHDPTQVNRQGPDVGDQYRTEIFAQTPEQAAVAEAKIAQLNASGRFRTPVATRVSAAGDYWPAEEFHQKFNAKRRRGLFGR